MAPKRKSSSSPAPRRSARISGARTVNYNENALATLVESGAQLPKRPAGKKTPAPKPKKAKAAPKAAAKPKSKVTKSKSKATATGRKPSKTAKKPKKEPVENLLSPYSNGIRDENGDFMKDSIREKEVQKGLGKKVATKSPGRKASTKSVSSNKSKIN
ncbi:hypothetical protein CC80DRAFT_593378 [Byssothecium circinans]|uniref:Uncharacterized protein n=1 Tax=Byssothecium circinans TaxID=147558 RepID=A0A6A5TX68_9PLEO|nr:hypothetical protein CC80DRAFT_593378 [Byssothecium circinans]